MPPTEASQVSCRHLGIAVVTATGSCDRCAAMWCAVVATFAISAHGGFGGRAGRTLLPKCCAIDSCAHHRWDPGCTTVATRWNRQFSLMRPSWVTIYRKLHRASAFPPRWVCDHRYWRCWRDGTGRADGRPRGSNARATNGKTSGSRADAPSSNPVAHTCECWAGRCGAWSTQQVHVSCSAGARVPNCRFLGSTRNVVRCRPACRTIAEIHRPGFTQRLRVFPRVRVRRFPPVNW